MSGLVPILTFGAFRDFAAAGNKEPNSREIIRKVKKTKQTLNPLNERVFGETVEPQFRRPRFRENNSTPQFSNVIPVRIIVALN